MNIDVTFEIRGRIVELEEQLDSMERQLLESLAHRLANVLGEVRCETHGLTPSVRVIGEDVHHLEFRITGCCADLINKAMDQVRQPDPKDWWKTGRSPLD